MVRVWFGMAAAALLAVAGALGAAAKDTIHVRLNNPTDMEWKVEVRDMVCDNAVVWQGRMKPGEAAKVTVCADGNGAARLGDRRHRRLRQRQEGGLPGRRRRRDHRRGRGRGRVTGRPLGRCPRPRPLGGHGSACSCTSKVSIRRSSISSAMPLRNAARCGLFRCASNAALWS